MVGSRAISLWMLDHTVGEDADDDYQVTFLFQ